MKIAYCFSGHLRGWKFNKTLKANLFDVNPPGDVIIHTYSHHNFAGHKWHTDNGNHEQLVTGHDLKALADLCDWKVANVDDKIAGFEYMPAHLDNCGFRHTRQRVNELRREYEAKTGTKYDLVCMMRFDIGLHEPLIFPERIDPNTLYAAYNYNMVRQGLDSDTITYGTPEVIDAINIPAVPPEFADKIDPNEWCGEKLCTAVRKLRGIDYKTHKVRHYFCRSGGGRLEVDSRDE